MHAPPARLAAVAPPFRGRARRLVARGPCLAATDPVGPRRRRSVMCLGLPGPLSVSFCGEVDYRMCLGRQYLATRNLELTLPDKRGVENQIC